MVFFTLWLQLLGFTDYSASVLMALFAGGCAIGSAVGGYLGKAQQAAEPATRLIETQRAPHSIATPHAMLLSLLGSSLNDSVNGSNSMCT